MSLVLKHIQRKPLQGWICGLAFCLLTSGAFGQALSDGQRVADQTAIINFAELASEPSAQTAGSVQAGKSRLPMRGPSGLAPLAAPPENPLRRTAAPIVTNPSPPLTTNFFSADETIFVPPDTMGAVGPDHIVGVFNGVFVVQNRNGGLISRSTLGAFWASLGVTDLDTFDPKILYDAVNNRWIFVTMAFGESTSSAILLGVSQTSDPTGQWVLRRYDADANNVLWADYPSIGYNNKWIAVSVNMFGVADDFFDHAEVYAFDKADFFSGGAGKVTVLPFSSGFTPVPAVTLDETVDVLYLVENQGPDKLRISTISGKVGAETLNVGAATVTGPVSWDSSGIFVPQRGSASPIDGGDARIQNVVYRSGSLWCAHAVFFPVLNPTRAAVQWWELNPNGNVLQHGLIEDPTGRNHYSYPTIAVNRNGDVMVGHAQFSPTDFGSGYYSFRRKDDPAGTLRDPAVVKLGQAPYDQFRWGDYSATVVDPVDDSSFWTIQQYTKANGDWGTWWGYMAMDANPDGIMTPGFTPPPQSNLRAGVVTNLIVRLTDAIPVTNATVVASNPNLGVITFGNQGFGADAVAGDNLYSATITVPNILGDFPLRFDITAPGKTNLSTNVTYFVFPPPENDLFARATKIPASGATGANIIVTANAFATYPEPGEPAHAGATNLAASIWYNWSPTTSGTWLFDTSGSAPDTVIAIYTGSAVNALKEVASNDDHGTNRQAYVSFSATAGLTYRIAIAGKAPAAEGAIRLRVELNGQPDLTPPVLAVTSPPSGWVTNVDHILVTGTAFDPIPNASGVIKISVLNLEKDPAIESDVVGLTNWTASVRLFQGKNKIQAFAVDAAGNHSRSIFFLVEYRPDPLPNDLFAKATVLPFTAVGSATGISTDATKEINEPNHGGNEGGASLWWVWKAPETGLFQVNTLGSHRINAPNEPLDTLLAIYGGLTDPSTITNFARLGSALGENDDVSPTEKTSEVTIPVQQDRIYWIAVDSFAGEGGVINLHYSFLPSSLETISARVDFSGHGKVAFAGMTPSTSINGSFPSGSTVSIEAVPDKYYEFDYFETPSGIDQRNPLAVTLNTSGQNYVAHFKPHAYTADFEGNSLSPLTGSWSVTGDPRLVAQGNYSATSGSTGPASTKTMTLVQDTPAGFGSFEYRVSSEPVWDKLQFLVNGKLQQEWSGEVPWSTYVFPLPAGLNTLEWRYTKDAANSAGLDAAFVDTIDLPRPVLGTPRVDAISIVRTGTSAQIKLAVSNPGGNARRYEVQSATSLAARNWETLGVFSLDASGQLTVPIANFGTGARFFRVIPTP